MIGMKLGLTSGKIGGMNCGPELMAERAMDNETD